MECNESYLDVSKAGICRFNVNDKIHWYNFCLESKDFTKNGQSEISLNGTVYYFSVDHSSIEKEDILNIREFLMVKSNIKYVWVY